MTHSAHDSTALQRASLARALPALGLALEPDAIQRLLDYLDLLAKWNRVYNLTAIRDPQAMLVQHLLDSLAIAKPLRDRVRHDACIVDVGTGAGLPGIPLAIAWPQAKVHLVEPVGKKVAFLEQARLALGLANVSVHASRVQALHLVADLVLCRAYASLTTFVRTSAHLAATSARLVAMKARLAQDELRELEDSATGWSIEERLSLEVPELHATRELVLIARQAASH